MENNVIDYASQKALVSELVEGRDLTKQLYSSLLNGPSSSSIIGLNVTQDILDKFERSLTILRYEPLIQSQRTTNGTADSPPSFSGSPKSPDSDGDLKDPTNHKDEVRKRKAFPRWTQKVQGCCTSGLEGPVEDGYNWRKYGQKDILGARYPRSYYRCTQRVQGCFATKQVQRSEDDPTFFEVTYRGKHTCYQASHATSINPNPTPESEPSGIPIVYSPHRQQPQEIIWSFERDVKDIKPFTTSHNNHLQSPSLTFPSTSSPFVATLHNNNFSTNTYRSSPRLMTNNFNDHHHSINTQGTSTSTANYPAIASQFSFGRDQGDLDHDFIFDNQHLFQ